MTSKRRYRKPQLGRNSWTPSRKQGNQVQIILAILVIISAWITAKNHSFDRTANTFSANPTPPNLTPGTNRQIRDNFPINLSPQNITPGTNKQIQYANYQFIDNQARNLDYRGNSVSELATLLSRNATTEAEKARIIYTWITHNIAYDAAGYLRGDYGDVSPVGVLSDRTAVCSGYANLYQALARKMGLDSEIIEGSARGSDYLVGSSSNSNHAWNGVKINNAWYIVDATWGAGTVNNGQFSRNFNPHYFATPPEQMIYSHFPDRSSWQLLPTIYTKNQFDSWPILSSQFFRDGLKLISPTSNPIQASGMVEVILQVPLNTQIFAKLQQNSTPLNQSSPLVQQVNGQVRIKVAFPASGTYDLQIFSKQKLDENYSHHVLSYRIIANSGSATLPKTYSSFAQHNAHLYTPTTGQLPTNQFVTFQIEVPNALEVMVIDESSSRWNPLTQSGNVFVGNIRVGTGKVSLVAKFPGDNRYLTLVEYH